MSTAPRSFRAGGRRLALDGASVAYAVIAIAAFIVAAGLVMLDLGTKTGLYGVTQFDDAVYYSAALHLFSGALPYRDFVMVQPPGITIVMAPVAALGRIIGASEGLAVARIVTGLVAGANAVGVVVLLRRYGLLAALFGGLAFAVFPPAYNADHTLMLEPYLVLFCLIAIWLAFPAGKEAGGWRLFAAGASFGVAVSIKVWGIFPLFALLVVLAVGDWRRALRAAAGAVAGGMAICGVFFVAAPGNFIRDVITSQLGRTTAHPTPVLTRLWSIVGLNMSARSMPLGASHTSIIVVTAVIAVMLVAGSMIPSLLGHGSRFEAFMLLAITLSVAALFVPPQYFAHYAYFTAPLIAIGVAIAFSRIVGLVRRLVVEQHSERRRQLLAGIGLATVLTFAAGTAIAAWSANHFDVQTLARFGDPGARIKANVPAGACVVTDSEALLVSGDRAVSSRPNCPVVIDSTGTWISFVPDHPPAGKGAEISDPQLVAYWSSIFRHVDYVVLSTKRSFRIPWTPALRAELAARFHLLPGVEPLIYQANRLGS